MQPLGTKVYLLKRYSPSVSFCTFFFSESVQHQKINIYIHKKKKTLIVGLLRKDIKTQSKPEDNLNEHQKDSLQQRFYFCDCKSYISKGDVLFVELNYMNFHVLLR